MITNLNAFFFYLFILFFFLFIFVWSFSIHIVFFKGHIIPSTEKNIYVFFVCFTLLSFKSIHVSFDTLKYKTTIKQGRFVHNFQRLLYVLSFTCKMYDIISYTVHNCPNTETYLVNKIHIGRGEVEPDMNFIDPIFSVLGQMYSV